MNVLDDVKYAAVLGPDSAPAQPQAEITPIGFESIYSFNETEIPPHSLN